MSTISAGTSILASLVETGDTSGNLVLQTNGNVTAVTIDTSQRVILASSVTATSTSTGALQVVGGVGIGGRLYVNGETNINTTSSTSTTTGALVISGGVGIGGNVNVGGTVNTLNTFGFKNRIINGGMTIAQRATSVSAYSGGGYQTLDRWNLFQNLGAMNIAQSSNAPTGFSNSMQFTVSTTASQTSNATSIVTPNQSIEGFNTADLMWGTANAKTITVSAWVYSNLVGQYAIWIRNATADRYYTTPFSVTTSNTWQQITTTIAGDTSGTWVGASTGTGLTIGICLAAGSSRVGTANTWSASTTYGTTGQVDWQATASNTFYITGVQLEVGPQATSFDVRDYGRELQLCQRYYQRISGNTTNPNFLNGTLWTTTSVYAPMMFPTTMRAAPTFNYSTSTGLFTALTASATGSSTTISAYTNTYGAEINSGLSAGLATAGYSVFLRFATTGWVDFSAEL